MKKNISINIGGLIFHIEEDGFDILQNYLNQVNTYFRKYEGHEEIVKDIESRIAEIFYEKSKDNNQIIDRSQIEQMIVTMGTVADFVSLEDGSEEDGEYTTNGSNAESKTTATPTKLYRDTQRKLIGGVAAGLGHYFKVDPLWSRVMFLVLFFGFLVIPPASGFALLLYIILWIVIPGNSSLEEDSKLKKLYRDPEKRVIGGVAAGIASYLNTDVAFVRLAFVLSLFFFGSGLIAYLALWIIAPEAKSMTDRMQMKGDQINLSNIENTVKRNLQGDSNAPENALTTIVLFPFRVIGKIFQILGKAFGPILEILGKLIRIFIALFFMFISLILLGSMVLVASVLFGLYSSPEVIMGDFPLYLIRDIIPLTASIGGLIAVIIPAFALGLLGLRLLAKRSLINNTIGWALFGVWILSLGIAASSIPSVVLQFAEDGEYVEEQILDVQNKTLVLDLNESGIEGFDQVSLTIRPSQEDEIRLVKRFESQGASRNEAESNAKDIIYNIAQEDSVFTFDSNISLKPKAQFRAQDLEMTLYLPLGQKFVMTRNLEDIIRNTIYHYDYNVQDMGDNVFVFTNMKDLTCLTCKPGDSQKSGGPFTKSFNVTESLDNVTVKGHFDVLLIDGENYKVEVNGRQSYVEQVDFKYTDGALEIIGNDDDDLNINGRSRLHLKIVSPDMTKIGLFGKINMIAKDITYDDFELHVAGFSDVELTGDFQSFNLKAEGLSDISLMGSTQDFVADLGGKVSLEARNFDAQKAEINAVGNSEATVTVLGYLNAYAAGFSEIDYYGNPEKVETKSAGISKITKR